MYQYSLIPAASSSATSNRENSDAAYAFDGSTETSWCEGEEGDGRQEILYVKLDGEHEISCISFRLGLWTSYETWLENGRPSELSVWLAGSSYRVRFPDYMDEYCLEFSRPIKASELSFRIESVDNGTTNNTYITDILMYSEVEE